MRRTRHTRRRTRHKRKHRRRRTRRHHKRRRTRRRRRRRGGGENIATIMAAGGGHVRKGGETPFLVSDIPPGKAFKKYLKTDKKKARAFLKKTKKAGDVVMVSPSPV